MNLRDSIPLRDPGVPTALRDERPPETGCGVIVLIFALTFAILGLLAFLNIPHLP